MSNHRGAQGATMTTQLSPKRIKRNANRRRQEEREWESLSGVVTILCGDHLVPVTECGCLS
jgi:hypothetical protein